MTAKEFPDDRTRWSGVAILFLAGCTASFHIGKIPASLPDLGEDLGLSLLGSSLVVSLFAGLIGLFGLLTGLVAGRLGYRYSVLLGLTTAGTASLVGSFSDSLALLLCCRAFEGIGWVLVAVSMPVLMTRISHDRDRSIVLGIWGAFVPFGMCLVLISSPVIIEMSSWRSVWVVTGVVSLLAALVVRSTAPKGSGLIARSITVKSIRLIVLGRAQLLIGFCFLVYSMLFVAVTAFMPTLLKQEFQTTLQMGATLAALVVAGNIVGNVASGWLLGKGFSRYQLIATALAMMGFFSLFVFLDVLPIAGRVLAAIALTAFGGLIPGTIFATAPLLVKDPSQVGLVNGLMLQAAGLGQLLGPPILATVVEAGQGWSSAVWFTLLVSVAGLVAAAMFSQSALPGDGD